MKTTICQKLSTLEESFYEHGDAKTILNLMRDIKRDAQHMEDGLKRRREVMAEAGIEDKYQKTRQRIKPFVEKQTAFSEGATPFYVKVINLKTKEILIDQTVNAGVVCVVNKFDGIDENGALVGRVFPIAFGHELPIFFAWDQLRITISGLVVPVLQKLKIAREMGIIKDPFFEEQFKEISKITNI